MFEMLMKNPYAWLLLSLCTIASLVFAVYTWVLGKKRKELSVDFRTNNIICRGKSIIPKLDIEFDGKKLMIYLPRYYIYGTVEMR